MNTPARRTHFDIKQNICGHIRTIQNIALCPLDPIARGSSALLANAKMKSDPMFKVVRPVIAAVKHAMAIVALGTIVVALLFVSLLALDERT
jgi:hypothetical protein